MKRTRKKYLVLRQGQAEKGAVLGVFSSRKRAEKAVLTDAGRQIVRNTGENGAPCSYYEKISGRYRLVYSSGKHETYRIDVHEEDSLCDNQIKV